MTLTARQRDVLDHAERATARFGCYRPRPNERSMARKMQDRGWLRFAGMNAHGMADYKITDAGRGVLRVNDSFTGTGTNERP